MELDNTDGRFALFLFLALEMDLEKRVEQVVAGLGYELVDFHASPKARILTVFIDKEEKGVTVEDCATVSNQLSRVFEVENVDYDRLEISSPGLDRPLKKRVDFDRFAGETVQIRMQLPQEGNRRNFTGVLQGMRGESVVVVSEGQEILLPFAEIDKARLVPRF